MGIQETDAAYYRLREKGEQDLADRAAVDVARIIHQTLADKYRLLAAKAEIVEPRSIDIVTKPLSN